MADPSEARLPEACKAEIDPAKLRDYALNPGHEDGRHKARVFRSALGFERADWEDLRDRILERVAGHPVTRTVELPDGSVSYEVLIPIDGPNGNSVEVVIGWIVEGDAPPRLTSAYVAQRRRRFGARRRQTSVDSRTNLDNDTARWYTCRRTAKCASTMRKRRFTFLSLLLSC